MRTLLLAVVFTFVSHAGFAGAIILASSDEGAMDYGLLNAVDVGLPHFHSVEVSADSGGWRTLDGGWTTFVAESGPLLSLTLTRDAGGAVVESRYEYDGGIFHMDFDLHDPVTGRTAFGFFDAPIIGLMTVIVSESDRALGDSAAVSYRLGPGLFDPSVAALLGVKRRTQGGSVDDPWLTFGTGDYTSVTRRLDEGAATVEIEADVAEPTALLLLVTSGLGLMMRRRRRDES